VIRPIYHVEKVSVGLKRKYRISADDGRGRPGEQIGYAEKQLTVADEVRIYRDQSRTELAARVRESTAGWLAALTGYEAVDHEGRLLGSFGLLLTASIDRTTWAFEQPGLGRCVGSERSTRSALGRRLLGLFDTAGAIAGALVKQHYDFARDGEPMFSIEKPKVLADWYRLTLHNDAVEPQLVFALAIMMEAGR
jgi:hypothetical protein